MSLVEQDHYELKKVLEYENTKTIEVTINDFGYGWESAKEIVLDSDYYFKNHTINEFNYEFLFYDNKLWIKKYDHSYYEVVRNKSQIEEAFNPELNKVMKWFSESYKYYAID